MNGKKTTYLDRSNTCVKLFLHDISKSQPLTTAEEYQLWNLMQQGDEQARSKLINANLRFAVSIASTYLASGAEHADLISAASLGLCKAVDKFDASLGFRLISFAKLYILSEVQKVASDHLKHHANCGSLDEPAFADEADSASKAELLPSPSDTMADWHLRYDDTRLALKQRLDSSCAQGIGEMFDDLLNMKAKGYTITDFASKYHLSERQLSRFLNMLRNESRHVFRTAA